MHIVLQNIDSKYTVCCVVSWQALVVPYMRQDVLGSERANMLPCMMCVFNNSALLEPSAM